MSDIKAYAIITMPFGFETDANELKMLDLFGVKYKIIDSISPEDRRFSNVCISSDDIVKLVEYMTINSIDLSLSQIIQQGQAVNIGSVPSTVDEEDDIFQSGLLAKKINSSIDGNYLRANGFKLVEIPGGLVWEMLSPTMGSDFKIHLCDLYSGYLPVSKHGYELKIISANKEIKMSKFLDKIGIQKDIAILMQCNIKSLLVFYHSVCSSSTFRELYEFVENSNLEYTLN